MCVEGEDPNLEASSTNIYHSTLWGYSQQNSYSGKLTFLQQIKSKRKKKDGSGNFQIKSDLQTTAINSNIPILCG